MSYLITISGHYYFRVRVPNDLLRVIKRKEIKKTLKTKSLKQARLLAKVLSYEAERVFTLVRCGMLTDEQIQTIVAGFLRDTLKTFERDRSVEGVGIPQNEDHRDKLVRAYEIMAESDKESLAYNRFENIEEWLDDEIASKGISVDKDTADYPTLARAMLKARIRFWKIEIERMKGNYDNEFDRHEQDRVIETAANPAQIQSDSSMSLSTEVKKQLRVSELLEEYIDTKKSQNSWKSSKTEPDMRKTINRFIWIIGDREMSELENRGIFDEHMKKLVKLPADNATKPRYRGKAYDEVIRIGQESGDKVYAVKTVNKALSNVSTLMSYGVEMGYLTKNQAMRFEVKDLRKNSGRKAYSSEDLQKLFTSPIYTDKIPTNKPHQFWIPLIGLFTGARVNEICSLYLEDIRAIDDVPCFDINENHTDKSVKEEASERIIPIHPVLIDAGFLGYVEKARKLGHDRLWSRLTWTKGNGYAGAFSQWYGRYLRKHVTKDRKIVFHSFRHTFIDNLKQHEVNQQVIEALDGHKDTTMTGSVYGKAYKVDVLYTNILKLGYGISFDGIKFPV